MAIDSAKKRRTAASMNLMVCPGVSPDSTKDAIWRAAVAWGYFAGNYTPTYLPRVRRTSSKIVSEFKEKTAKAVFQGKKINTTF